MNALDGLAIEALGWLWRASWQSALLVLLVLGLHRVLGRRLSPRWRYGLWWIVVARLVLPPLVLPEIPWPESATTVSFEAAAAPEDGPHLQDVFSKALAGEPAPIVIASTPAVIVESPAPAPTHPEKTVAPLASTIPATPVVTPAQIPSAAPAAPESGWPSPLMFFLLAWLAGALGFGCWSLAREVALRRRLRREPLVDDPRVLDLVARCKSEAGIRRPLAVVRTSSVSVPALFGFVRPRLLLPESALRELSPDQLGDVIRHELEHLRHHDVAWNWFLQALVCLHWVNPFVWIAATRLRTDRETVRDLGVLDREPARTGRDYGRTILRVVESSARFRARALLVGILEDRSDVKRRITMIARYDGKSRRGLLLGGILTCLLALVVTVAAAESPDAEPEANPTAAAPAKKAPKPAPRPWVLVTGYQADGDLFKKESRLDHAMEVVTEAVLTDRFQTVSLGMLQEVLHRNGRSVSELPDDPDLRLAVSKALNVALCISGWAVSFGERVVLVIEIIDPVKGLPGKVHRVQCDGVKGIPDAIETVLGKDGVIDVAVIAAAVKRKATGPRDLRPIYAQIPRDDLLETYPDAAYRKLEAMIVAGKTHGSAVEHAEAMQMLADTIAHAKRLAVDSAYRNEYVVRMNVRLDPTWSEFDYEVVSRPPYLLFVEKTGDEKGAREVARYAKTFSRLYEEFHRQIGRPLGLEPLDQCARPADRALKVFIFKNMDTFKKHQKATARPLPASVTSYYSLADRWVVLCGDGRWKTMSGIEDLTFRRLVHEGTHQLMHAYSKIGLEKATGDKIDWYDRRLRSRRLWIEEGLAEMLAGAMRLDDKPWDFASPLRYRMDELTRTLAGDRLDWSLPEVFAIENIGDLLRATRKKSLAPGEQARLSSLVYGHFWAVVHYLWNSDGGKYRDRLVAALKDEMTGKATQEAWLATWGATGPVDWSELETEVREHVAALAK